MEKKEAHCPECDGTDLRIFAGMKQPDNPAFRKVQCSNDLVFWIAPADAPNVISAEILE